MSFSKKPDLPAVGLRILLVEDEMMVAMLLEDMLSEFGHAVVGPVASLGKAVEMAQCEAVDLAILDVNLDGKEVYPVADALAARGIPFIFATGYGQGSLRAPYRDRVTLSKPFLMRDLLHAIATACPAKAGWSGGPNAPPAQLAS
jgi:CheY-like chemotaxis protein